jgi:adenosine deaminase
MSGTSLSHEFQECANAFGWGLAEFKEITLCAMNSAFIEDKSSYLKKIGESYDQFQR